MSIKAGPLQKKCLKIAESREIFYCTAAVGICRFPDSVAVSPPPSSLRPKAKLVYGILLAQIQKHISPSTVVPDQVLSFF